VEVRAIQESEAHLYDEFVAEHGGLFNSRSWKAHVHGDRLTYYGIFRNRDQLCAVFHLYTRTRFGLTFVTNPPFMPHAGLVIDNPAQNEAKYLSFNKDVLEALTVFLNGLRYSVLSIALPPAVVDTQPFFWNKYKVVPKYTYQHDLARSEAEIESCLSTHVRKSIRRAAKDGVRLEQCSDYNIVQQLVRATFARREKGLNDDMVEAILQRVASEQNSFAFVAHWEGRPVAVSFCLYDQAICYSLFSGYDHDATHEGAGKLCMYSCIAHAKNLGLRVFDFEGSMMVGVERYFRSFGPRMVPYYTINKGRLPLEIALKFVRREQF